MGLTHTDTAWKDTITMNSSTETVTLNTGGKYVDKDIELTVNTKEGSVELVTVNFGARFGDGTKNCTLSSSDTSGVKVEAAADIYCYAIANEGYVEAGLHDTKMSSNSQEQYITGVTLNNSKEFTINDGIYNWTFKKDSSGNINIY